MTLVASHPHVAVSLLGNNGRTHNVRFTFVPQLGSCTLPISFADMKEATACDWPNVALIGPNGGEVIGYLHLKMSYRSHSNLGRNVRARPRSMSVPDCVVATLSCAAGGVSRLRAAGCSNNHPTALPSSFASPA
jgi:hypothetical protein